MSDLRPASLRPDFLCHRPFRKTKGRRTAGLKEGGNKRKGTQKLWPGPPAPRGAGGLRNPEHDPNRALRQRLSVSQGSLARAWPKFGWIMMGPNEAVIPAVQIDAPICAKPRSGSLLKFWPKTF